MRKIVLGVVTLVTATGLALTSVPPASSAVVKVDPFSVMADLGARTQLPGGRADGVGTLAVTTGSGTVGSAKATVVIVDRVVAPGGKKDSEIRDSQVTVVLKNGTVVAEAVDEDPKGGKPESLHILPVTGGTGAYASARGTVLMRPVGSKFLMAYDLFIEKTFRKKSFSFGDPVTTKTASGGSRGLGSLTMSRAEQGTTSYISISTSLGPQKKKLPKQSIDLQIFDGDSTIFARGVSASTPASGKAVTLAILGGTGDYAGHRGEVTVAGDGRSLQLKLATPGGKAKPLGWTNKSKASYDDSTVLGQSLYSNGTTSVAKSKARAKTTPVYFTSSTTYPEIGGVTPVVTMVEQTLSTGTMLVTGMTLADALAPLPVIGGTGDYGGAMGQAQLTALSAAGKATATFRR